MLEFGIKRDNEERRDGGCGVVFDPASQRYAVGKEERGRYILFSGGVHNGEDIRAGILREVTEESGLYDFLHVEKIEEVITHYRNSAKQVNRLAYATCFLTILKSTNTRPVAHEAHEKFSLVWTAVDDILENWNTWNTEHNVDHWIYFLKKSVVRARELGYDTTSGV